VKDKILNSLVWRSSHCECLLCRLCDRHCWLFYGWTRNSR